MIEKFTLTIEPSQGSMIEKFIIYGLLSLQTLAPLNFTFALRILYSFNQKSVFHSCEKLNWGYKPTDMKTQGHCKV